MTTYNLDEIKALINQHKPKCICGTTLRGANTRHYGPHTSGIHLQNHTEKQWIYVTCTKCGYDMSLTKILKQTHTHDEKKHPQTTQIPPLKIEPLIGVTQEPQNYRRDHQ